MQLNSLEVGALRGIRSLVLNDFQDVNLLLGDNDAGKTTVLEAIKLFSSPGNISSIIRTSRMRFPSFRMNRVDYYSAFETFLHLFPFSDSYHIDLSATTEQKYHHLSIDGELVKVLKNYADDELDQPRLSYAVKKGARNQAIREIEVTAFDGVFNYDQKSNPFEIDEHYSYRFPVRFFSDELYSALYVSPISHLEATRSSHLSKAQERQVVKLLRLIDPDIEGFKLQQNELTGGINQMIEHRKYGDIPLYTYGDGMKKIFFLATRLASIKNGILLLDEIETSLQASHLSEVFSWLIHACRLSHIQLFATTHSLEAIAALAKCAVSEQSELACYRLEKANGLSYAKRFSERELDHLVNGSGIDVR